MASIFTYEPDTPRVSSPWHQDVDPTWMHGAPGSDSSQPGHIHTSQEPPSSPRYPLASEITRLQPEPQEGPVEYKLHLLLRPRRKFQSTSTSTRISGSKHARSAHRQVGRSISESLADASTPSGTETASSSSTQQTRQHRLEQLTTQLLWRLQQSSPHHTSSASNIILPTLPEALPELQAPQQPARLLHGLEESQGALYEIGVADDGNLVGLADDEMEESLNNLRAMAACLGCTVEVLRNTPVGSCEWLADAMSGGNGDTLVVSKLSVAEALVRPFLHNRNSNLIQHNTQIEETQPAQQVTSETQQLRVTLIGPTMSGKSTLLGTLTTSTLDNGRGTSRLSMHKHRHEINSGVTSSVSQELLGYNDIDGGDVEVVNYATENIASWIDMHDAAGGSRLVIIADSAGHPRYRRTTVRGLMGCSPHWTLMCFPADDTEDTTGRTGSIPTSQQSPALTFTDVDLSAAQLGLCLKLRLPLVIVITKLDLASRSGLKSSLTKVLDALKAADRKPAILPGATGDMADGTLQVVHAAMIEAAYSNVLPLLNDPIEVVPIVLTSAVQGTGISALHALLHELPVPDVSSLSPKSASFILHIEETFQKPAEVDGVIISGILRCGQTGVGGGGVIGPFSVSDLEDSEDSEDRPSRRAAVHLPTSRSFPGALRNAHVKPPHLQLPNQEWRRCRIVSIRNLRLPVHTLLPDQMGTLAIVPDDGAPPFGRIRKGMVLAAMQPSATRSFVAEFLRDDLDSLAVGNHVVVYIASVRASAKVVSARVPDSPAQSPDKTSHNLNSDETFGFDDLSVESSENGRQRVAGAVTAQNLLVTFRFNASKEFALVGDKVLVMPGGGPGLYGGHERGEKGVAGLDGFVGAITDIFS